ncbi:MAG: 50S ribosomal protein L4 [Parcubacteria group bacterium GW2011_GWE2_38_18]|nr:MAG: 50S ribosomal protein L4 [Parcubacteria group bacterium GW2011_GWE2_38_18]
MPKVKIYNQQAEQVGEQELSTKAFELKVNESLVHQSVVTQLANERQVLAHTKGRSDVRGGGKKPWKQKGTGRARAGSSRSPIWIGGGVTFGPLKDRNFTKKINKKMKQQAIFMALSDKFAHNSLTILDKIEISEYKTKVFNNIISAIEQKVFNTREKEAPTKKTKRSVLIVLNEKTDTTVISGRNLAGVEIINLNNINIVDLLKYKELILTADAVKKLEERVK